MRTRATWIVTVVCVGVASLPGRAAPPLAERLPSGALAYVGWAGRNLTFDGSMVGQLLNDPWVAGIFGSLKAAALKNVANAQDQQALEHWWAMGAIAWQRPAAAALFDLRKGQDALDMAAVLLLDLDKDRDEFAKHLEAALALVKDEVTFTDAAVGALACKVHKPRRGPQVAYGYLGNVLFVTAGEGVPARLAEAAAGRSLAADRKFADCMKAVGDKDVQLAYYVDVPPLCERLESFTAPPPGDAGPKGGASPAERARQVAAALGLDGVTAAAATVRVVDRGLYTHARLFAPGPHRGLLMALAGPPLTDADLAGVPADADLVAAVKVSPAAAYDELRRAVKAADARADEELGKAIGEIEEQLGLSLTRDVLAHLGEGWVLASAASQGGFLTGTLVTAQVKDGEKLWAAIRKMESRLQPPPAPAEGKANGEAPGEGPAARRRAGGPTIEVVQSGRVDIHYLAWPGRAEPLPVAPAWAVHKNRLYLAAYPQVIQAALARGDVKPITQEPAFVQARGRMAGKPSVLVYVNTPRVIRHVYHWMLIGWTVAANALPAEAGIEARPAWLPPLSSIEQYLWPDIAAVSSDAEGISFEGYGSLPSAGLLAPLLLNRLPVYAAVPAVTSAHQSARTVTEINELRQVVMALMMYQADQDGRLPASLADPKLAGYLSGEELRAGLIGGKWIYVPPRGEVKRPARTVLVYLPPGEGRPLVPVAFADGHIETVGLEALQRMLKEHGSGSDGSAAGDMR